MAGGHITRGVGRRLAGTVTYRLRTGGLKAGTVYAPMATPRVHNRFQDCRIQLVFDLLWEKLCDATLINENLVVDERIMSRYCFQDGPSVLRKARSPEEQQPSAHSLVHILSDF